MGICFHSCRKLTYLVIRFSCAEPLQSSIFFFPSVNMGSHSSRTGNREDEILQGRHEMKANSLTWLAHSALRKKKKDSCLSRQHFFLLCNWVSNASPRGERGADAWILSHVLELLWWIPCCCSVTSCPTRCKPMDCSTPGFPVLHCLLELAQIQVHWVGDAIQPSHLLLPSSFAFNPSQGITTNKLEEGCCECYYTQRQPSCT